jgi:hypothetical protein
VVEAGQFLRIEEKDLLHAEKGISERRVRGFEESKAFKAKEVKFVEEIAVPFGWWSADFHLPHAIKGSLKIANFLPFTINVFIKSRHFLTILLRLLSYPT